MRIFVNLPATLSILHHKTNCSKKSNLNKTPFSTISYPRTASETNKNPRTSHVLPRREPHSCMQQVAGQHSHLGIPPPYVVVPLPLHAVDPSSPARPVRVPRSRVSTSTELSRAAFYIIEPLFSPCLTVMIKDCFDGGRWSKVGSFEVYVLFRRRRPHDLKKNLSVICCVPLNPPQGNLSSRSPVHRARKKEKRLLVNLIYRTGLYLATIAGFQCIYVYIKKEFVF